MPTIQRCLFFIFFLHAQSSIASLSSYDALRLLGQGDASPQTVTAPGIAGSFHYQSIDPHGNGDDGGIVIAASDAGYWVRSYSYGPAAPIELDWFEPVALQDLAPLIVSLAAITSPSLYLRVPSQQGIYAMGFVDLDLAAPGLTEFHLLESNSPVILAPPNNAVLDRMFHKDNFQSIRIGGPLKNLRFQGLHLQDVGFGPGVRAYLTALRNPAPPGYNQAVFDLSQNALLNPEAAKESKSLYFSADCIDTLYYCLAHNGYESTGDARGTQQAEINASFINSGARLASINDLALNTYVSDPYGDGLGWNGEQQVTACPNIDRNNGWNLDENGGRMDDWPSIAPSSTPNFYRNPGRQINMVFNQSVTGSMSFEYGAAIWFMSLIEQIGNSQLDPLEITYKDTHYMPDGTWLSTCGFQALGGKADGLQANPSNAPRYIKLREDAHDFGMGALASLVLEATSEDGNGGISYFNEGVNIELENVSRSVNTSLIDYEGDYSRGHSVTGNTVGEAIVLLHEDTAFELETKYIYVSMDRTDTPNTAPTEDLVPENTSISNSTILDGGFIKIDSGASNINIESTTFGGGAREVISIENDYAPTLPVTLSVRNLSAAAGSKISAFSWSSVTLDVGGIVHSLENDYFFGVNDFDQDGYFDEEDNCPSVANPYQSDSDADGHGNACDVYTQVLPSLEAGNADGFIEEFASGSGSGGGIDEQLPVTERAIRVGDKSPGSQYRSIMSFSRDGLPAEAQIESAKLVLTEQASSENGQDTSHQCAVSSGIFYNETDQSLDGWLQESASHNNTGVGADKNLIGSAIEFHQAIRVGYQPNGAEYRSQLYFDIASLPDSADIVSAAVELVLRSTAGSADYFNDFGPLHLDWTIDHFYPPNGIVAAHAWDFNAVATHPNVGQFYPTPDAANMTGARAELNQAGFDAIAQSGTFTQGKLYWDVDLDENNPGQTFIQFYGSEDINPANHPRLLIDYIFPDYETQSGELRCNPASSHFADFGGLTLDMHSTYFGAAVELEVGDFSAAPTHANVGEFVVETVRGLESDLKQLARSGIESSAGNFQLRAAFNLATDADSQNDFIDYFSSEASQPNDRPQVLITYKLPDDFDTDGDGLIDGVEASIGTNILLSDTDGDGLSDFAELNFDGDSASYAAGTDTDPLNPDTDGDGYLDGIDPYPLTAQQSVNIPLPSVLAGLLLVLLAAGLKFHDFGRTRGQ